MKLETTIGPIIIGRDMRIETVTFVTEFNTPEEFVQFSNTVKEGYAEFVSFLRTDLSEIMKQAGDVVTGVVSNIGDIINNLPGEVPTQAAESGANVNAEGFSQLLRKTLDEKLNGVKGITKVEGTPGIKLTKADEARVRLTRKDPPGSGFRIIKPDSDTQGQK